MKEFATNPQPIIQAHYPLPKRYQFKKPWITAQSRKNYEQITGMNRCTEAAYHRIIDAVKQQHLVSGKIYFERDFKFDKSHNCCAMHSFMTSSFYIYLECNIDYIFRVEFAFNDCAYESEIRAMLKPYPLDRQATEVQKQPDFHTLLMNVLHTQDECYLHSLNGK